MTLDEIKKYEKYIKKQSHSNSNRYIDADDLIQSCYERLLSVNLQHVQAPFFYINYAIKDELRKHCPAPFKQKISFPPHVSLTEIGKNRKSNYYDNHYIVDYAKKIFLNEKIEQILKICNSQQKQFILLFLKDLTYSQIAKKMNLSITRISQIFNQIKKNCCKFL